MFLRLRYDFQIVATRRRLTNRQRCRESLLCVERKLAA